MNAGRSLAIRPFPVLQQTNGVLTLGKMGVIGRGYDSWPETGLFGWGGRDRTFECWNQNPVPYHLATPQQGRAEARRLPCIPAKGRCFNARGRASGPCKWLKRLDFLTPPGPARPVAGAGSHRYKVASRADA
jgi:hypothetical protein